MSDRFGLTFWPETIQVLRGRGGHRIWFFCQNMEGLDPLVAFATGEHFSLESCSVELK